MDKTSQRRIVKRTEQQKLDLISQWEQSGLPIKTFCQQHDFSDSLFHTWLNKYRRKKKVVKKQKGFVPLQIKSAPFPQENSSSPFAEIEIANGNRIKIYQPVPVDFLQTLLS
jgi:transposase-like protein